MTKYIGQLQAKLYRMDATMIEARRNEDWDLYDLAEMELNDTLFELKQAEWREANK